MGIHWHGLLALILCMITSLPSGAVTVEELKNDPKMSAKRFASYFTNFDFEYHDEIQPWDVFLTNRRGDCDDYATLADHVLHGRGIQTRLITVRMPGLVHVVCYVQPDNIYLDFNYRIYLKKTVSCKESLYEIAEKVAKSFDANWTSASEFTFEDGLKRITTTIAKTSVKP